MHEALELRDNNPKEYLGKGVLKAVENVNVNIGPKLIAAKLDPRDQQAVDAFLLSLDGTASKCAYCLDYASMFLKISVYM